MHDPMPRGENELHGVGFHAFHQEILDTTGSCVHCSNLSVRCLVINFDHAKGLGVAVKSSGCTGEYSGRGCVWIGISHAGTFISAILI